MKAKLDINSNMPAKSEKWRSVSLPESMVKLVKELVDEYPELGYKSVADFITAAIRAHPDYTSHAEPYSHFNVYDDHVTIWDKVKRQLVDVYFSNKRPYLKCSLCEEESCEHARFVLTIPKVLGLLREKGWLIEDGRVKRVPD
jgi:hypothetical protein